jgi:hypothetical protein
MTHGIDNMEIFRQIEHFSKALVVWGAKVQVLVVCGTNCKMASSLEC